MISRPAWLASRQERRRANSNVGRETARVRALPSLRWSVVVASPGGQAKEQWGDTWFARDLVTSLRALGQRARVVTRSGAESPERDEDDVVLVLRGLRRVQPRRSGRATWLLWVISHPDLVEVQESVSFDAVFAASSNWSRGRELGAEPLLQATNPSRFNPAAAAPDSGARVLFVGSSRGEMRPIVRDALEAGVDVTLYGVGWQEFVDPARIAGDFLPNVELPAAYASARVVLNDHWADMANQGFLSNRLFDAVATGTRVLSDEAVGLKDVLGDVVRVYNGVDELREILADPAAAFPSREVRLQAAERIARDESFDARAAVLVNRVLAIRGLA